MADASIVTIGNELVSGDVADTNGSWLAKRLASLGIRVRLLAAVPDEIDAIAELVRAESARSDVVIVTGGLGGTPDDITREALAHAFAVGRAEVPELAADLRARFHWDPDYAAAWAHLPVGSEPLHNPRGGAPGFRLDNVYVLPGLPAEMEAMFDAVADRLQAGPPIVSWRHVVHVGESRLAPLLREAEQRWPGVLFGSYPSFGPDGPTVELVAKSTDPDTLAEASEWLQRSANNAADGR